MVSSGSACEHVDVDVEMPVGINQFSMLGLGGLNVAGGLAQMLA